MSKVYKHFHNLWVVRRSEILAYYNGDIEHANNSIRWMVKSGKAQTIKRGLYYLKQPNDWYKKEVLVSPWLIASRTYENSVIAYHSALRLYGDAYSETSQIQVAVNLKKVPASFKYQDATYLFYRDDISFGLDELSVKEVPVKTFTKERILLEGLKKVERFFGIEEFLKSIEGFKWIDLDRIDEMLPHYSSSINMRLGWLLEKFKEKWFIDDRFLNKLNKKRPEHLVFLVPNIRRGNILNRKWNLLIPKTLAYLDE